MAKHQFNLPSDPPDRYLGNDMSRCPGLMLWGPKNLRWRRGDGGCFVGGKSRHPCDDTYTDRKTGKRVEVRMTYCRHATMPCSVRSPADLRKLKGVRSVREIEG